MGISIRRRQLAQFILVAAMLGWCGFARSQEDEQDQEPFLPGLIATLKSSRDEVRRIDEAWPSQWIGLGDSRLTEVLTEARWEGLLRTQTAGDYRLHLFGQGRIEIRLAGNQVKFGESDRGWATSEPISLAAEDHPLEIRIPAINRLVRLSLFWSGPQFGVEPIPPRFLRHERKKTVSSDLERGYLLNSVFRCTACHARRADPSLMDAPSLARLSGNVRREWLIDWLMQGEHAAISAGEGMERAALLKGSRRMPLYALARDRAEAIAAFLLADRGGTPPPKPGRRAEQQPAPKSASKAKKGEKAPEKKPPSAEQGERLFLTLGCLACHQRGELGESGLFGGGDLTKVAAKRPDDFFARWLADPAAINPRHRMPVFELSNDERTSLSLYLSSQDDARRSAAEATKSEAEDRIARGRELVKELRCGNCHELPDSPGREPEFAQTLLDENTDWTRSCAGLPADAKSTWGYALPSEYRQWLEAYFRQARKLRGSMETNQHSILKNNCLACHAREGFANFAPLLPTPLADKLAVVAESQPELAPLIPAMTPPSLNSVGDKLTSSALTDAIRRTKPPYRSYLLVQMPRFALKREAEFPITSYFWSMDQIPRDAPLPKPETDVSESALAAAGGRLVSTDGFGCVSCHQIGSVLPDKAPLNARGPTLSRMNDRIRREWFDRFVADPARIVPRMEMPSVKIPVKGVLGDKVQTQLAAVWHVLSKPGFEPPEPNPVRVLRLSGMADRHESPIVINDVVKISNPPSALLPDRTFIQPLLIGLTNRQNFMLDLEEGRLAAWWAGDVARQRTKGKSWHWELGGPLVMSAWTKTPELAVLRGGKKLVPLRRGQHVAQLRGYETESGQVRISYGLYLGDADHPDAPAVTAEVIEVWSQAGAKVCRELVVHWNAEDGDRWMCELTPDYLAMQSTVVAGQREVRLEGGTIQVTEGNWSLASNGSATGQPVAAGEQTAAIQLVYAPLLAPDTIDTPVLSFPADAEAIEVAPGFAARRLPLPGDIMPTALAWRKAPAAPGSIELIVGSLKGQVTAARDSDGDGLEDASKVLADGLATPYGIADGGDALHVLTKQALVAVKDRAVNVLASGWGHTDDYHDWAVGLPRNEKGEYFIGLPCQQDERSAAAAKFRGSVLKLTPRMPTDDDPRRYDVSVVSTGHRFPMGMALNRSGDLFVTDNQGNYNPFNELNHVRPGAFFGFINANQKKDKSYEAPPLDAPAIDIPHPWTRSVNGICFLDTPEPLRKEGKSVFGPLEGHLVGCEYDTRRLVRMTLQKVAGDYQGAAYPLSLEPSAPEKGFLGPIVCAVSPRGELYVGSIRDSGWGAGNNIGEVVQVKLEPEKLPAGIGEVRAVPGGFEIDFLREVDDSKAAEAANYAISSYRRESTPAYGGPDLDRRIEKITAVQVAPDRRRVTLKLGELREGYVYELQLKNLTADGSFFHPAEAHYTLRKRVTE